MVLVDTSVWVAHLRSGDAQLVSLLERGEVVCHPFVIGELACGHLPNRADTLRSLGELPQIGLATFEEVMNLIATRRLMGTGLGFIDVHLLASALIYDLPLLTRDQPFKKAAAAFGVLFVS
jgi:predicted nucleic acid-binding protein